MRACGILMHITSLPSKYGTGDMGPGAYSFADFLEKGKQSLWQVLPLNPIEPGRGNSPYNSLSAFAGNKYIISPDILIEEGLLSLDDIGDIPDFPEHDVDYERVIEYRTPLLKKACRNFLEKGDGNLFSEFCSAEKSWLDDYADFAAFSIHFDNRPWNEWPDEIRDRNPDAIKDIRGKLEREITDEKILQYLFARQWKRLKAYCNNKRIQIIGDMPYYIDYNSVDVWANQEIFRIDFDGDKRPVAVSGVPPDYFSETGQLWNNPVYNWESETAYKWWARRMAQNMRLFDITRIDHFRGFASFWEIPAGEKNAQSGKWTKGPGEKFFNFLQRRFACLPVIAEDLGYITPDVRELIYKLNLPGMKVLQFAFNGDTRENPYMPHNLDPNTFICTGTHDNNTTKGWYMEEAKDEEKRRIAMYTGKEINEENISRELIRLAMMSVSKYAVFPFQDAAGLGSEARMNRPGSGDKNWRWRCPAGLINDETAEWLRETADLYGRA